jgi:hypothetical protein
VQRAELRGGDNRRLGPHYSSKGKKESGRFSLKGWEASLLQARDYLSQATVFPLAEDM